MSTGPKQTSVTRYNATTHGIMSSQLPIRDGEEESFEAMRSGIIEACNPEGTLEELQVEMMTSSMWRWRRVLAFEREAIEQMEELSLLGDVKIPGAESQKRIERYEAHLSRQFFKALHELQRLQAFRVGRPAKVPEAMDLSVEGMPGR